jgi:spore maturation protein CgeB
MTNNNTSEIILIVRGAFGDAYEPAWQRALIEKGHKVQLFDCHERTLPGLLGRLERRLLMGPSLVKMRRDLVNLVKSRPPTIILLYQGHYIDFETVNELSKYSFVTGYHNDNPFWKGSSMLRYRHFRNALPAYDGFHVFRPSNIIDIKINGIKNVDILMPGYLPWVDYPRLLSSDDLAAYQCDVLFAGHYEEDCRGNYIRSLLNANFKLGIYGDLKSWNSPAIRDVVDLIGPIKYLGGNDYRKAIAAASIALCFFSKKNNDVYTRRVFEITACRGFLLSERTPEMTDIFPEGKAADFFDSEEELLDKVRFYKNNQRVRERISKYGYEYVKKKNHDIYSRMSQWIADVKRWRGI